MIAQDNATTARPHLRPLTSLRFFAALLVVVFHSAFTVLSEAPWWVANFFGNGYNAVSFFFVLSGFVLTYVYGTPSEAKLPEGWVCSFWRARFARIYPAYFAALLIALPVFIYSMVISKMISGSDFLAGFILVPSLLQAWWPPTSTAWNIPAWSLSVEGAFYMAFPLLLRFVRATRLSKLSVISISAVVIVSILRDWLRITPGVFECGNARGNFINYFPLWFLPHFVFGMTLSMGFLNRASRLAKGVGWIGIPAAIGLVVLFSVRSIVPAWMNSDATLIPLFGAVIIGAAQAKGRIINLLSGRLLVQLGEASYALYILHMPMLFWYQWIAFRFGLRPLENQSGVILFILISIALSYAVYYGFERPARRWLMNRPLRMPNLIWHRHYSNTNHVK